MALEGTDSFTNERERNKKKKWKCIKCASVLSFDLLPHHMRGCFKPTLRWGLRRRGLVTCLNGKTEEEQRSEAGPPQHHPALSSSVKLPRKKTQGTGFPVPQMDGFKIILSFLCCSSISIHQPCHQKCWRIQSIHLFYMKMHFMPILSSRASCCLRKLLSVPSCSRVYNPTSLFTGDRFLKLFLASNSYRTQERSATDPLHAAIILQLNYWSAHLNTTAFFWQLRMS